MTPNERKRMSKTTLYKCKRNEQDHPIRMQEKKNKWTTHNNTIYKNTERGKVIPQEHQRHKLATIPTTAPMTTSTTTPAMTTTPMCCLAQSVGKSLYFMPKSIFL